MSVGQRPTHAVSAGAPAQPSGLPAGAFVLLDGEEYYRISGFHLLAPFLVNLASDTDLWMFIASSGGLTAGRINADGSLFPYLTSDQLYDAHHHSGPLTLIRVEEWVDGATEVPKLWEPFAESCGQRAIERNLYKSSNGNRIVFEEIDHDLGLRFEYRWAACDAFGWVRSCTLENRGESRRRGRILDGFRNVLPWGAPLSLYQSASNLVDAYKKSEVDPATGLGIFALTAGITDRPEAVEVLRANTVWCCGLKDMRVHLTLDAIHAFRRGSPIPGRNVLNGRRGNYLAVASFDLQPGQRQQWHLAADAGRDHLQIAELRQMLMSASDVSEQVETSLRGADEELRRNVASADGLQLTARPEASSHHFLNVLFNNMRGGVFLRNSDVPVADFLASLHARNKAVADRHGPTLRKGPGRVAVTELRRAARETGDPDFARLAHEYLPLHFGRRHGDPSRPWNRFEIRVRDRAGRRVLHHEGNWRDIFQNWEALGAAFPDFLPSMVARFVNASTVDGFNPYRITRDGVDWEVPAPGQPWSNLGYWGDHQIVYLLRLLEAMDRHDPLALPTMLAAEIFSYADVPYRLRPYADILRDPRATIVFDTERARLIDERVARMGTDGRLLMGPEGGVYHANLFEKLLVPALSKLSNLIPDAGIWMNTQRPEWNDANNALGGGSVSVLTLCHLRRYLSFLAGKLRAMPERELPVSAEIEAWFQSLAAIFERDASATEDARRGAAKSEFDRDSRMRKRIMDALGEAFSEYRAAVYAHGFSERRSLSARRAALLCETAREWIDRSIAANRREDGLYHTYNQLAFSDDGGRVRVTHLQEMLEGQVAVLSSGAVPPAEGLAILERLFASALYRPDQRSFMLYPERDLPGFLERNAVPEERVAAIPLLQDLLATEDRSLLARDACGTIRFHGDIRNAQDVGSILDALALQPDRSAAVARDKEAILALFDFVFGHRSYTGRSAAMYAYEGIGCIYWHMVAKLLLAVQEMVFDAERASAASDVREGLACMYSRVQSGLGYRKPVAEFGTFPIDPYSHTPPSGGAQQPGMTGQVKEEILCRLGELGVRVSAGEIEIRPLLLDDKEFLAAPAEFRCFDVEGRARSFALPAGSLAFTFCQIPVIYERVEGEAWVRVVLADGSTREQAGTRIESNLAAEVFHRGGRIDSIRVGLPARALSGGSPR